VLTREANDRLLYAASAGQVDRLSVAGQGSLLVFALSSGRLEAAPPCVAVLLVGTCPGGGVDRVLARLGDRDDAFSAALDRVVDVDGGPGRDTLQGGAAGDLLDGGSGDDVLRGVGGPDDLAGGEGADTVLYDERSAPVIVTLDGAGNDGGAGEGDNVRPDVEAVVGGSGADALTGDADANVFDGGAGNDLLLGEGGADVLRAGPGDDRILARDGVADAVDCGPGTDEAITDPADTVTGCESVAAAAPAPSAAPPDPIVRVDADRDGVPAPADCNDADRTVRPGAYDRPGDGRDQDCSGRDASLPRLDVTVSASFRTGSRTRVRQLDITAPADARVRITCRGRGCPSPTTETVGARRRLRLGGEFRGRRLRPGAVITIRVTKPGTLGTEIRFTVRRGKAPRRTAKRVRSAAFRRG